MKGLNVLLATLSTPVAAPVVAATRLRKGSANSARGAARLVADALVTAKAVGADPKKGALVVVRADSAYYAPTWSPRPAGTGHGSPSLRG